MRNKVYIHIGYPKCFSTTLQRSFFEKHPECDFFGVGLQDNVSYHDDKVELIFESLLKYSNTYFYDRHKNESKKHLSQLINNSNKPVFSSEWLAMNTFQNEISSALKYERILDLFEGFQPSILLVKRDVISFIRSFYKESVRLGLPMFYDEYLIHLMRHADRTFIYEVNFSKKIEELKKYFGNNITVLDFEKAKVQGVSNYLNQHVSNWMNISNLELNLNNDNPSLTDSEVITLVNSNKSAPRGLGLSTMSPFEKHRNRSVYELFSMPDPELYSDVIKKRDAIKKAGAVISNDRLEYSKDLEAKILEFISSLNE